MMKIVLTGGGTGGHVYPALAVAEQILDEIDAKIFYYGTEHGPERAIAEQNNYVYRAIPASQVRGKSPKRIITGLWNLWRGTQEAQKNFKKDLPDVVFATGGYVAAPVGRAAKICGIPLIVFQPDIYPGWAIKFLTRYATSIACTSEKSLEYLPTFKTKVTGYPIRKQFFEATKNKGKSNFTLIESLPTLLVFGGSLGSHSINATISKSLHQLLGNMQIIHITGTTDFEKISILRKKLSPIEQSRYHIVGYTNDIANAMAASDLTVTRAGASILGELPASGLPAVIVPGNFSDQLNNANLLVEKSAAAMISENELDNLPNLVNEILSNPERQQYMANNMHNLHMPNATAKIIKMLMEVA